MKDYLKRSTSRNDSDRMKSRRNFLICLGAVSLLPLVASCAETSPSDPKNQDSAAKIPRTRTVEATNFGAKVQIVPFPLTAVGLTWTGPQIGVQIRFYNRSKSPGPWMNVDPGCPCGRDPEPDTGISVPKKATETRAFVPADGAYGYEVRAAKGIVVERALAVDTEGSSALVATGTGGPPKKNPSTAGSAKTFKEYPGVKIVSRAGWGADESKRFLKNGRQNSPTVFSPLQAMTVHHTVTSNADPDPAATVRAIYELHTVENNWGDIGYHFLIDASGVIYEGRFSGNDGAPAQDAQGNVVTAFHTEGFNTGNLGIAMLGDFTSTPPTKAAQGALTRLAAVIASEHRMNPTASVVYRNPATGATHQASLLNGHRDWISTECPGNMTYANLTKLRNAVAAEVKNLAVSG
ncbi:peptidoglycan recognition family protein [Streptomyces sp. NPDC088847]|uniref:peptidoglycan recognition protein family protein n=1 Tax=Streptomyces sp. NPDC088847 TaxID=3365909 RepID=UPI0037FF96EA